MYLVVLRFFPEEDYRELIAVITWPKTATTAACTSSEPWIRLVRSSEGQSNRSEGQYYDGPLDDGFALLSLSKWSQALFQENPAYVVQS